MADSLASILHKTIREYERENGCAIVQIDIFIADEEGEPPNMTILVETRETFVEAAKK